jgi:hypothetical protein
MMETNPYRQLEASAGPPSSGSGVKSRLIWFVFGFIASWAVWSAINYGQSRPKDFTPSWPVEIRDLAPDWIKQAQGRKVGSFIVIAAADTENASAMIYPSRPNHFPNIVCHDDDTNGLIDGIFLADAAHRSISLDVTEGRLQSYTYSTGIGVDAVSFEDADLDGNYNYRIGPGRHFSVMIDSEWHDVIDEDNKRYVELRGTRTPLNLVDGIWRVATKDD